MTPKPHTRIFVYDDGSCPLCRREILFYGKRRGGESAEFVDVSEPRNLPADLLRADSMVRFHVRDAKRRLVDGGHAFAELWKQFPAFRWLGLFFSFPAARWVLALEYDSFLPFRLRIQSWFRPRHEPKMKAREGRHSMGLHA
jgi:predicted DCC family thiol-disulfide oxidoreductase YuxK